MYFQKFQKRFKRQETLLANHAQAKGMLHLRSAPNQTAKGIELDSPTGVGGDLFNVDAAGNVAGAGKITALNLVRSFGVTFDGGGSALVAGTKLAFRVPTDGTVIAVTSTADVSGSSVVDIKKCTLGTYPGSLTSIVASAPPTLSLAQVVKDSTLTGWTTTISADDMLEFSLTSSTTITKLVVSIDVKLR